MTYEPKPIETGQTGLPGGLAELMELLAKNTHDIWSRQRFHDGWTYGPQRDDINKKHPGLVPYEELPDSEREYDRKTAAATLRAIVALKYDIRPPAHDAGKPVWTEGEAEEALARMDKECPDLSWLLRVWERISETYWVGRPNFYELLGKHLVLRGELILACNVFDRALGYWPQEVRLRQLQGLALAGCNATLHANAVYRKLLDEGNTDGDTFGGLGRTEKDLGNLQKAYQYYHRGYEEGLKRKNLGAATYSGINAAAMVLWGGDPSMALGLARQVDELCRGLMPDYWTLATQAEAALILSAGDLHSSRWKDAQDLYYRAADLADKDLWALCSMRKQARHHLQHFRLQSNLLDNCFGIPNVAVFVGHMIDSSVRPVPRFPESACAAVKAALKREIRQRHIGIAYLSLACGADILFLEAALEMGAAVKFGGEIHAVLPFPVEQFRKTSVTDVGGERWGQRFDAVLAQIPAPVVTGEHFSAWDSVAYDYCGFVQTGLAVLRAQQLDSDLVTMAVWDGQPGGVAGTAYTVRYWKSSGRAPVVIDPARPDTATVLRAGSGKRASVLTHRRRDTTAGVRFPQQIMALLMADVYQFSKVREEEIPLFVRHFLGEVAELQARSPAKPVFWNTWGDALFYVFTNVADASTFALELRDMLRGMHWAERGLPESLSLRIALHAGPVYSFKDPIMRKHNYMGMHVNRTARLEPQTPPGEVYASEAFAALVAATGVKGIRCEYVGLVRLAKDAGLLPTYHVRPEDTA
ncbi:MAG: RyR domain-containing protein [Planctomycetota bacterium]